jgi:hypothetical protein
MSPQPPAPPSKYRAICAPIIERVLKETAGLPAREVQARLREAYPFGARINQPYRIWREEIQRQGGPRLTAGRPPKPPARPKPPAPGATPHPKSEPPAGVKGGLVVLSDEPELRVRPGCRSCAYLGGLRSVTDHRGARRLRRHCDRSHLGWTDIDWPACPHYQARAAARLPR